MRQSDFLLLVMLIIFTVMVFTLAALAMPQYVHAQEVNATVYEALTMEINMLRADAGQIVSFGVGATCAFVISMCLSGHA